MSSFPNITLEHFHPQSTNPSEDLEKGQIDFSTSPAPIKKTGILQKQLFSDTFVCLYDKRHSMLSSKKLTMSTYSKSEHLFIAPHGGMKGAADSLMELAGKNRFVRASIVEFSLCPWLLDKTDLIVNLPSRAAKIFAAQNKNLVVRNCPVAIPPIDIYLSWHERTDKSPAHQWLRNLIVELVH